MKLRARRNTRKWEATCHAFSDHQNIGGDIKVIDTKVFACPAEARLYLVDNHKDRVFITYLPESFHEGLWRHHIPTLTQYRFLKDDLNKQK